MSSRPSKSAAQVQGVKNLDIRRLWGKLHNNSYRENCYAYYREASFEPVSDSRTGSNRNRSGQQAGFIRRVLTNTTEKRAVLAIFGVLGLGIGVTRMLAMSSQTSSSERVDAYMDSLRADWEKYQKKLDK
jgi:uncharacterized protein HemX